jgi:hypothetical protein
MNQDLVVRRARPEDAERIATINNEGVPGVTPLTPREAASIMDAATLLLVAETGGNVAGYLIAYEPSRAYDGEEFLWFRARSADFLYVDQIAVAKRARGAGIGRALYEEAARAAGVRRLAALVCEVNIDPPNPQSMAFHHRLGFAEIDRLQVRLHSRYVALMRKPLGTLTSA